MHLSPHTRHHSLFLVMLVERSLKSFFSITYAFGINVDGNVTISAQGIRHYLKTFALLAMRSDVRLCGKDFRKQ